MINKKSTIMPFTNIYNSTIGDDTKIANFVEIGGAWIGNNCKIQAFTSIPPGTVIGHYCFVGPGVRFGNDKYPEADGEWQESGVHVEDFVSIGANCVVLPGVRIGKNSFIAAGVVVNKDVPPNSFVVSRRVLFIKPLNFLNKIRAWQYGRTAKKVS